MPLHSPVVRLCSCASTHSYPDPWHQSLLQDPAAMIVHTSSQGSNNSHCAPQLVPALAACHGPHYYKCVCKKSLLLHKYCSWSSQLSLCICIDYSHYYCFPWSPATGPGCTSTVSHSIFPGPNSCWFYGHNSLGQQVTMPSWYGPVICSHTGCPALSIANTSFPPTPGEDLSLLKLVH